MNGRVVRQLRDAGTRLTMPCVIGTVGHVAAEPMGLLARQPTVRAVDCPRGIVLYHRMHVS